MYCRSPKELALLVVSQRKKLGLSQAEVGNRVGLKQKTISAFENKPESTKISTLFQILSAVSIDINISERDETSAQTKWQQEW
ncbi:MAG: helix-turn-helix domain-containing protein [Gammaproteobacteria bacterium]|jgi:HTH-type transcriptional regulator/antitoxin HipB|nr:helix-turn-helix domain-containing protein [Gammaproteobacteria bacterium]